jgi:hypothetical protein
MKVCETVFFRRNRLQEIFWGNSPFKAVAYTSSGILSFSSSTVLTYQLKWQFCYHFTAKIQLYPRTELHF